LVPDNSKKCPRKSGSVMKKKYHEYKSFVEPKDFKNDKVTIWVEPKAYNKLMRLLHKIEDKFIDEKKIKKGKKSPIIISECYDGKWQVAGPINTPQTHNMVVGAAKSKDEYLAWRRSMVKKPSIDLVNYIINETDELNTAEYQSDKVKWCKKELMNRNYIGKEI
jgi:hypothetical protein